MADRRRTLEKQLYRQMKATAQAWSLLAPGDRIMVAMSGGKDSYTLLHLLRMLVPRLPFEVELVAAELDAELDGVLLSSAAATAEARSAEKERSAGKRCAAHSR